MTLTSGARLGPYEIVASIGAGGMGAVYRARDTRLDRDVAIKVLRPDVLGDADRRRRFEQEARAVSRLNHPGIVTLFEMNSAPGDDGPIAFLVMEFVAGEPLSRRIRSGPVSIDTVLDLGVQAAEALAAAHEAGIVHRDLKPANIMITPAGRLKILDFGLARFDVAASPEASTVVDSSPTETGLILGTLGYLSPEQAMGERAHAGSDLFALGVVLYEMLAGASPFTRDTVAGSLAAVVHEQPASIIDVRADSPAPLAALIARCLAKRPADRPASAREVAARLAQIVDERRALARPQDGPRRFWLGAAAMAVVAAGIAGGLWVRGADERWARTEAVPALGRLVQEERVFDAWLLAREVELRVPDSADLARIYPEFTYPARFDTEPAGATIEVQDYVSPDGVWHVIGQTPVESLRIPVSPIRVRVTKPGFDPVEASPAPRATADGVLQFFLRLPPTGTAPPGMVHVAGGVVAQQGAGPVEVPDFWIDRLEVTNEDYQRFVDDGGYRRPELWRHPIVESGRELSWDDALTRFRDSTGRPGPATWELGRFREGTGDLPVGGVSWYEAAAYAEWAGKSLPTYYHWYRAALPDIFSEVVLVSRLGGEGPVKAGSLGGLGPWGTLDMAGNVKEWAWNASGTLRYALGAAWNDPPYLFGQAEAFPPLRRTPDMGFRCVKLDEPPAAAALAPVEPSLRDFARERPVSDEVFQALVRVYDYDRSLPLDVRVEHADDSPPPWRLERVSIAAAYGNERVPILLFLPKSSRPPYSVVVYFPDSSAETATPTTMLHTRWFEFLVRAGRAVAVPIFKNMHERHQPRTGPWTPTWRRDLLIAWSKDLGRTLDYLETRPDVDATRSALHGFSLGAVYGPVLAALESRLRAMILLGGGLNYGVLPPEADPYQFASRVRVPTLMIAGREDFVRPVETLQRPLFDQLGVPSDRKKLAVFEGGHLPPRLNDMVREMLDWLDRWLGPVSQTPSRRP